MEVLDQEILEVEEQYTAFETAKKVYDEVAEKAVAISEAFQHEAKEKEKVREILVLEQVVADKIEAIEVTLEPEVLMEIDAGLEEIKVLEEVAAVQEIAEEAVRLANAGGSEEADNIKIQFDVDQENVESTTLIFVTMEKAEVEAIENEKLAKIDEDFALHEKKRLEVELVEFEVLVADIELAEEKAKEKVEDCQCNIADIPKYKQEFIDLTAQKEELQAIRDQKNQMHEEASAIWEENRIANE
jgi:hypothetical protein